MSYAGKGDLRCIKTEKAISKALLTLLTLQNFRKITVRNICEEALISRATFYAHYLDKYDLLERWLINFMPEGVEKTAPYDKLEKTINLFVNENGKAIKNIAKNADNETLGIVFDFLLGFLDLKIEKEADGKINQKYVVFSNLLAGGLIHYLLWHIENEFEYDVMNIYLYNLLRSLREGEI